MSLTLKTVEQGHEVIVDGEPFYIERDILLFPAQKVLLIGDDCKWYDHLSPDGINGDAPIIHKGELDIKAYDLSDHRQVWLGLNALYGIGIYQGKSEVRSQIRKALAI